MRDTACTCPPDGITATCPTHQEQYVTPVIDAPMKVAYMQLSGYASTAYVEDGARCVRGCYAGTNKHADEPVWLRWDGRQWTQAPGQCVAETHANG